MPFQKPDLLTVFGSWTQDEQETIDWLDRLRTNALTLPNHELATRCEQAMARIENLVRNLHHSAR